MTKRFTQLILKMRAAKGVLSLSPRCCFLSFPTFLFGDISFSFDEINDKVFSNFHWFTHCALPILILFIGIVLHELVHGITWAFFAKNGFKSIRFGVMSKGLTPYCHCTEPLKVSQYQIGAMAPLVVIGLIPAFYALIVGNFFVLIFGVFFIVSAIGDIMIVSMMRHLSPDTEVQDHPSEPGFYIFTSKEKAPDQ